MRWAGVIDRATRAVGGPKGRPAAEPVRHRRWLVAAAVVALLLQMAVAMVTTAVEQTPTIDEPVYVGTAVDSPHHHRVRYNPEHPPLGKLIIATGVALIAVAVVRAVYALVDPRPRWAVTMLAVPRLRHAAPYVLVPAAVLLLAALDGARNLGVRYAVFVPMFLAVAVAVAAAAPMAVRRRWAYGATLALVLFVAVSSLRTYPYYLPYR